MMTSGGGQPAVLPNGAAASWERISVRFGAEYALRDLTLTIPAGAIVGLFGPSGCGKTTAIRLLLGLVGADHGHATLFDTDVRRLTAWHRQQIGYMPQQFVLYPNLTALENLDFVASLYGLFWFRRGQQFRRLLDVVELWPHRRKLARELSGGMQRRLALACTLVHRPNFVILDEPTAGVDPIRRQRIWAWFRELAEQERRTLIVTSQYVTEAEQCDQVAVMDAGQLIAVAPPRQLRRLALGGDIVDITVQEAPETLASRLRATLPQATSTDATVVDGEQLWLNAPPQLYVDPATGVIKVRLVVRDAAAAIPRLSRWLLDQGFHPTTIGEHQPSFDTVFGDLLRRKHAIREGPA